MYGLRVPASRVGYAPEAQGGLPPGPHVLYGVRLPAFGVGYVPGTVATQVTPDSLTLTLTLSLNLHGPTPVINSKYNLAD